ncbi:MAG: hypothetical protein QHC40_12980 [Sphingobium sp.]|nr:hypothetical protein [Sphingobium sp.]
MIVAVHGCQHEGAHEAAEAFADQAACIGVLIAEHGPDIGMAEDRIDRAAARIPEDGRNAQFFEYVSLHHRGFLHPLAIEGHWIVEQAAEVAADLVEAFVHVSGLVALDYRGHHLSPRIIVRSGGLRHNL